MSDQSHVDNAGQTARNNSNAMEHRSSVYAQPLYPIRGFIHTLCSQPLEVEPAARETKPGVKIMGKSGVMVARGKTPVCSRDTDNDKQRTDVKD